MQQQSLVEVDRITLIYDDNNVQPIHGGRVRQSATGPEVLIEAQYVPREHINMEVVAAHTDGSVEASFTVGDMWMESSTRVYSPD